MAGGAATGGTPGGRERPYSRLDGEGSAVSGLASPGDSRREELGELRIGGSVLGAGGELIGTSKAPRGRRFCRERCGVYRWERIQMGADTEESGRGMLCLGERRKSAFRRPEHSEIGFENQLINSKRAED